MRPLRRKLLRDLGRNRAQFLAVALTVFLGVAMFVASYDSYLNLQTSYETTFTEFRFANVTLIGGDSESIGPAIATIPGVESVQARTVADQPIQVGDVKMLGRVVGIPSEDQPSVNQLRILKGAYPAGGEMVLVEEHLADHFELSPGDSIEVLLGGSWQSVEVAGVVASPEYVWPARSRADLLTSPDNFGVIFAVETATQRFSGLEQNEVAVYFDGGTPDEETLEAVVREGRSLGVVAEYTRDEQPSNAALEEDIKGFEEMAGFFPVLFLTAAGMATYVMMSRLVHSQRPQIGVMLANGLKRGSVLRHYLGYGVIPGLLAAIPGAIVGLFLGRAVTRLYTSLLAIPVTVVELHPVNVVNGVAFGLAASVLAVLAPALVASRIKPADAMRGESPSSRGKISLPERLIPPLRRLPVRWRMALRGVGRNPRRTVYTVVGVVLSLMLILVSWGMIDTINHLMDLHFNQIEQQDASVYFAGPVDAEQVSLLEGVDGVARAEPALELPVSVSVGEEQYESFLAALQPGSTMHRFLSVSGDWVELPTEGILVGKAIRDFISADVGDSVTLAVGGFEVEDTIVDFLDEPLGTVAYISRGRLSELAGAALPATSALIAYGPGIDGADVRSQITDLGEVAAFNDANVMYDMMQKYMTLFYAFVGVMLLFGAAMAFALIFNAMSVNIAERSREVATLLAVGTDRRTISRLIAVENLAVAAMGIPIGLVVGYFTSKAAMASFSSDLFAFDLYIKPTTFVLSALAILLVALLSQWPGLRALRRLVIPKIIKERAA